MGRSGSGKSTLLNLIAGIDDPDSGSVEVGGERIDTLGEPARTLYRRRNVGFVYQFFNLLPTLDARENVALALEMNGVCTRDALARAGEALANVGLEQLATHAIDTLSGGEQQRVAIARALVHRPRLLLADEPTGNLDAESAAAILPLLLARAGAQRATVVIVTHDPAVAAQADRVLRLEAGRLLAVEPPA